MHERIIRKIIMVMVIVMRVLKKEATRGGESREKR